MQVKISVTTDDIIHGVTSNCQQCPIARAMQRYGYNVSVVGKHVGFYRDPKCINYTGHADLPRSAQRFINRFDNSKRVEPFNFLLNIPGYLVSN